VINNFTFDGATRAPMQQAVRDALIGFMTATAQAQAEATEAAQQAGIEHPKAKDGTAYLGRKPSYARQQFTVVRHAGTRRGRCRPHRQGNRPQPADCVPDQGRSGRG
jgi:putative DNA-invertase from lambdoid prophage Rac